MKSIKILIGILGVLSLSAITPFAIFNSAMINKGLGIGLIFILTLNLVIVFGDY